MKKEGRKMEIKEDNQTLAFKKLDELRERLYFEGRATRDFKILFFNSTRTWRNRKNAFRRKENIYYYI